MNVRKIFRLPVPVEGDVGLEIEVEGSNLPRTGEYWNVEHDGSLRGEGLDTACEYVFRQPLTLKGTKKALTYLKKQYEKNEAVVNDSPRCGVHVHVNCQKLTIVQLYNFMTAYLIFEELLVNWCGPTRVGNLFCLRVKDAEYLLYSLVRALETGDYRRSFATDELRYASMNVKALATYGSLEFRAMRGTDDVSAIYQWAEVLVGLRENSQQFPNPIEMVVGSSMHGLSTLVEQLFGEHSDIIFSQEGWEQSAMDGVRRVQEVAYAADWEELSRLPKRLVGGLEVEPTWDDDFPPTDT